MTFIKANCKNCRDTSKDCYLNLNFIVSVFPYGTNNYIAYTDTQHTCDYIISKKEFDDFLEREKNA